MTKRLFLAAFAALMLVACSPSQMQDLAGPAGPISLTTPAQEQVGTGRYVIGLLAADEPGNLSDGLPNSSYLAGKLAATTVAGSPVTLEIRRYDGKIDTLKKAGADLVAAGVRIIIGPSDDAGAAALAKLVAGQNVVIISLAALADSTQDVYAAGLDPDAEAAFAVAEMVKRGYRNVAIATNKDLASKAYAAALAKSAKAAGLVTLDVDVSNTKDGISKLGQLIRPNQQPPHAVAFATGPVRAAGIIAGLRSDPRFADVAMVGNSGWAISAQMIPVGSKVWYSAFSGNNLADFAQKFSATNMQQPTLTGAMVYDLVVLSGALPQLIENDPYAMDVLTNPTGFTGQTGAFRFDLTGKVQRSFVIVDIQ